MCLILVPSLPTILTNKSKVPERKLGFCLSSMQIHVMAKAHWEGLEPLLGFIKATFIISMYCEWSGQNFIA